MISALKPNAEGLQEAYDFFYRRLDKVMLVPFGPERWKAARDLLVTTNPIAGTNDLGNDIPFNRINRQCIKDNAIFRNGLINKFGGSDKGRTLGGNSFRASLAMPRLLYRTIELVDPTAFRSAKNRNLMFKTFPEYTRSEATNASKD